ncbi:hypothetical protein [Candidatus Thiosymbion oneisti]|uniref:hypothetical protein n=1 Tax=Candidatus Thiosymbion oneisti TaxID=589554 RepID=UPI0013FD670B|nr:hypothetical protein [Candidatus Thiosymbion oneisti]
MQGNAIKLDVKSRQIAAVAQFEKFMLGRSLSGPFNATTQWRQDAKFLCSFFASWRPCVFSQFPIFRELSHYPDCRLGF